MLREKIYELKNWKLAVHTTWNPGAENVMRIHLVPPRFLSGKIVPSVVILNGQEIVPVSEAWAILLTEFIRRINQYENHAIEEKEVQQVLKETFGAVRKIYPKTDPEVFHRDLSVMLDTFEDVIAGKIPQMEIAGISLGEYAPYMRAPHRMDLMVSAMTREGKWHCNQKCIHCYAAGQPLSEEQELDTESWKKIIRACRKAGITQLTFTGGEPTLRDDLCKLILEARWFVTRLNTNGIRLTKELCAELVQAELDSVQGTFYSADPDIHNELVGGAHYEETVAGIRNAVTAGINLSINTPLCSLNKDYLETLKFLHNLGVRYVTCSGLIITGNARTDESVRTQLSGEQLYQVLKEAAGYCYANNMEINFTSPGWIAQEKLQELGLDVPSCGACLSNMAVTPDGKVVPCQSWLSGENFGKMGVTRWEKIWNHPDCKARRMETAQMKQECPLRGKAEMTR